MTTFNSFKGIITMIDEFYIGTPKEEGCYKLMTIQNNDSNIVNFVISPHTFFVDYFMMNIGDLVEGFYDANAPPCKVVTRYLLLLLHGGFFMYEKYLLKLGKKGKFII